MRSGKSGLPVARAVELTGAKSEKQLLADIEALNLVWIDPTQGEWYGKNAKANADGSVGVRLRLTPGNYLMGVVMGYGGEASVEGLNDVAGVLRERVSALKQLYVSRER